MTRSIQHYKAVFGAGLFATLLVAISAASIVHATNSVDESETAAAVTSFSDEQLQSFAEAYVRVEILRGTYAPSLERAENLDQIRELQDEINQRMVTAIEDAGLTTDEYSEIAIAVSQDTALREKAIDLIRREQPNGPETM